MYDVVIIDLASTEFNRGSFCYLPYILYSALKEECVNVCILEDFTLANIDSIPESKEYLISLWSYPQLDACFVLNKFIDSNNVSFFGYYSLIDAYEFNKYEVDNNLIEKGCLNYYKYFNDFKFILLSDCDMHLSKLDYIQDKKVYPLFTSYGCPNGCSFCPSTVNCFRKRVVFEINDVCKMLNKCYGFGIRNIHFTDEDFFFDIDRTFLILNYISRMNMNFNIICLGSVNAVSNFIDKYSNDILVESGVKLIEVGLETADDDLAKSMHKSTHAKYEELANKCDIDIFWLTLTFHPGETIKSIRGTGKFLKEYGFKYDAVVSRIRTNGTIGGLGQFFQPYHGTKDFDNLSKYGVSLSDRPIRLIPSFVPNSFLDCKFKFVRTIKSEDMKWFKLYKLNPNLLIEIDSNLSIKQNVDYLMKLGFVINDIIILFAQLSRLGIIEQVD